MRWVVIVFILILHALMLGWSAFTHSPLVDEPAHLVSGLSHWKHFSFDLYRVNPPLVRSIAVFPLYISQHEVDWKSYTDNPCNRTEFAVGFDFLRINARNFHILLFTSRLFCIPFSLLGALICYFWAREVFGNVSGLMAFLLWCFSPMVLAFGYTIMPDVACAALGATACYFFWKWIKTPTWNLAILLGVVLGIAELTKFTLLVFYPIWTLILGITIFLNRKHNAYQYVSVQIKQFVSIFVLSLFVINIGYGFEGSFTQLKNYDFVSRSLCGNTKWNYETGFTVTGNRFRGYLLGEIPVPLPANFVMGIDVQKKDFELGYPSYFWGEWSNEGWYQYYIVGLLIKEPLGFWCLFVYALIFSGISQINRSSFVNEMMLFFPIIVLLVLVSSQTRLNHHLRYVIPIFPFLFISISRIGNIFYYKERVNKVVIALLLMWSLISSLSFYPHSQAHFNELIGSHRNAPKYLLGSNIDWGQNMLYLSKWLKEHSNARPFHCYYKSLYQNDQVNIIDGDVYFDMQPPNEPEPGWFALGVNEIYEMSKQCEYFKQFEPVNIIGYSVYIYHITLDEANRVRQEMGLPDWKPLQIPQSEKEVVP